MSNKKNNNTEKIVRLVLAIGIAVALFILGITRDNIEEILGAQGNEVTQVSGTQEQVLDTQEQTVGTKEQTSFDKVTIETGNDVIKKITNQSGSKIYYFDVGQADSILIVNNGKTMLIDAGNNEDGDMLVNYINTLGISKIDILVGTHPHEDHIGGMDNIIKAFDIGTIYMPKVQTNTKTFEEVIDAISAKGLKVTTPKIGDTFGLGEAYCEVMSIGEDKSNLNTTSIVIRMVYNDVSYLFTGDMETSNESARQWPQTDILKVAHHGSRTSSSEKFLKQVMPKIAVIQVEEGNSYSHPHDVIIKRLEKLGIEIYRNDLKQTILIKQE